MKITGDYFFHITPYQIAIISRDPMFAHYPLDEFVFLHISPHVSGHMAGISLLLSHGSSVRRPCGLERRLTGKFSCGVCLAGYSYPNSPSLQQPPLPRPRNGTPRGVGADSGTGTLPSRSRRVSGPAVSAAAARGVLLHWRGEGSGSGGGRVWDDECGGGP
jgi:hypothetical protein